MMTLDEAEANNYSPLFGTLARVYDDEVKVARSAASPDLRRAATMGHCAAFVRTIPYWSYRIEGYDQLREHLSSLFSDDEDEHSNEDLADALLLLTMFEDQYKNCSFYLDGRIINRTTGEQM